MDVNTPQFNDHLGIILVSMTPARLISIKDDGLMPRSRLSERLMRLIDLPPIFYRVLPAAVPTRAAPDAAVKSRPQCLCERRPFAYASMAAAGKVTLVEEMSLLCALAIYSLHASSFFDDF